MARFDVYRAPDDGYWLDCQSDFLSDLNSRFVVPLRPRVETVGGDRRLHPVLVIDQTEYVMQTHFAAAIPAGLLRQPVTNFLQHEYAIGAALDLLVGRY